jgi:succinyl-diaminopimelate desuccinylase
MDILKLIDNYREDMVETLKKFISINSVNPAGGGPGEKEVADWLEDLLKKMGFSDVKRFDPVDDKGFVRSNLMVKIPGKTNKTIWIVTHIDTVPEGDRSLWKHDPFDPVVEDDKIYGRGSEDNGGSMVASIYTAKAFLDTGIQPGYTMGLALVADEEAGSEWGIEYLIEEGAFSKNDLFLVPDAGNGKGDFIEIAEKSIIWLKFEVSGKQGHASVPRHADNAFRKGVKLVEKIDKAFHERFSRKDKLFDPPGSTFEPTKVEKTVENINTIPGRFVFYYDCRVLPSYRLDEVVETAEKISKEHDCSVSVVQRLDSPDPTPPDSELVLKLKEAIKELRGFDPKVGGIGGGTCAAHFRMRGWHAVVWSTIDETAHQPNEYKRISHMVEDAKVFARLFL